MLDLEPCFITVEILGLRYQLHLSVVERLQLLRCSMKHVAYSTRGKTHSPAYKLTCHSMQWYVILAFTHHHMSVQLRTMMTNIPHSFRRWGCQNCLSAMTHSLLANVLFLDDLGRDELILKAGFSFDCPLKLRVSTRLALQFFLSNIMLNELCLNLLLLLFVFSAS